MDNDLESKFLSGGRTTDEEIKKSFAHFQQLPYVKVVLDAFSSIAMIIDKNRQIVYANKKLTDIIGAPNLDSVLGLRPGELLSCKHSINQYGGCGTTEACRYCGAALSIQQSIEEAIGSENECRISVEKSAKTSNLDLLITASPLNLEGDLYVILSIADISNEKRRKVMERVFFHDVVNTAGGLKGLLDFITNEPDSDDSEELLKMASHSANQLLDEILMHRTLVAAESGELVIKKTEINIKHLLSEVREILLKHEVSIGKEIIINNTLDSIISIDPVLLKRIMINLLKNALEASKTGEGVTMGHYCNVEKMCIFVQNKSVLTEEVKAQIFQRSFSTKGNNRGIGTYSIKILTENYLNGKVRFSSTKENGTEFTIELPLHSSNNAL